MKLLRSTAAVAAIAIGAGFAVSAKDTSEEMRDVGSFDQVQLNGSMDVEVKVGGEQSVRVVADSDIISHIETEVRGGTLRVGLDNDHRHGNIKKMIVYVTVPSLKGAALHGSGDMIVEDAVADDFEVDLHGSGDMTLKDVKFGEVELELQGSGDIEIDGTCDAVEVELQGSGDIEADDMKCKSATVSVHGSGDVSVTASEEADISVHGSGDVVVSGSPDKLRSKVRGSGDIEMR
ncbi:MAG: DUF2807 domain-containing protein [Alphaproteobacteria bacterium]|nr:DUF2807 domain-containing protein [Alphaproteobacteria bacterium]